MIYADYIKSGGTGIISLLYQNQALKFLPADLVTPLDRAFTRESGQKVFVDDIQAVIDDKKDLTDIALELKVLYGDLWSIMYQAKPDTLATSKETTTGNGSIDTKNQVAGYDSDTMVDDNAINRQNSNTETTTKTNYLQLDNVITQLRKSNFWSKIKVDLNNYLFLTIYN